MKYIYVPIYARNVWFPDETDQFFSKLINKARNPAIKKWINKTLRNYITNNVELPQLTDSNISSYGDGDANNIPDWITNKYKSEEIFVAPRESILSIDGVSLDHLVDYLNSLEDINSINSNVPDILEKVRKWDIELKTVKTKGIVPIGKYVELVKKYSDGYHWVSLKSRKAQVNEGREMKNCLQKGYYWEDTKEGRTVIYSLRDKANHPHVSIEVTDKDLNQVKGKENQVPVEKYHRYVVDFVNNYLLKNNVDVRNATDVENMGLVYNEDSNSVIDPATYKGVIKAERVRFTNKKNIILSNYDIYNVVFDNCDGIDFSKSCASVYTISRSTVQLSPVVECKSVTAYNSIITGVEKLISLKTQSGNIFSETSFPDLKEIEQISTCSTLRVTGSNVNNFPKLTSIIAGMNAAVTVENIPELTYVKGDTIIIGNGVDHLINVGCNIVQITGVVNPNLDCSNKKVTITAPCHVTLNKVDNSSINVTCKKLTIGPNQHVKELKSVGATDFVVAVHDNCVIDKWDMSSYHDIEFGKSVSVTKGSVYVGDASIISDNCKFNYLVLLDLPAKIGRNVVVENLGVREVGGKQDLHMIKKMHPKIVYTLSKLTYTRLKEAGFTVELKSF